MGGQLELFALSKSGRELPVDISLGSAETASGLLVVVCIRDFSEHRNLELGLKNALAEIQCLKDRLSAENVYLREEVSRDYEPEDIVGESDLFKILLERVDQVATTDSSLLIVGETGTGKELIARRTHDHSARRLGPFVRVNCASLPPRLIESELFGYEKGAFTGALGRQIGRFELADGGTVFLDEIGELPLELQAKLLHVLQNREFERIGGSTTIRVDMRVMAATNRDLQKAMREDRFRPDLYYRLAVVPVEIPPLRLRRDDIPLLAWHFVAKKQVRLGKNIEEISPSAMEMLTAYDWPGNVRELENVIERAMILSRGSILEVEEISRPHTQPLVAPPAGSSIMEDIDREHIVRILNECKWRVKGAGGAAGRLGLNPSTLYSRMKKLGIQRP
jgi:transcriptional regulator with GAF, ATPase, and Fis domain